MHAAANGNAVVGHTLRAHFIAGESCQFHQVALDLRQGLCIELDLDRLLAHGRNIGEPHAVGRQHAGERVNVNAGHAEFIGHQAGMLAAGAAEARQRVFGHVVAALHRDELDGVGHVGDGDPYESLGNVFGGLLLSRYCFDLRGERSEFFVHHIHVERLIGTGAEHFRKMLRPDLAQHDIAVGHRQRPAAAIARGPRIGAGRIGPDAVALSVEMQDGAAACRDGVNGHHGRAHAHAGDLGFEFALQLSGIVRYVGRCPAHVEADDFAEAGCLRGAHHADYAARRAGENRILALKALRIGQPAAALHEHYPGAGQLARHLIDIAPQDRRQISVDHGGIAARHQLHQRAGLVRRRYLRKAGLERQPGNAFLMLVIAVAVHENDGDRTVTFIERGLQIGTRAAIVERDAYFTVSPYALLDFDDFRVEQFGQRDVPVENARPVLVGDAQRIAESARDEQHGAFAFALEQGIGGHRRAHFDGFDVFDRDGRVFCHAQQMPDSGQRRVAVLPGIFREQLVGFDGTIGLSCDDVGEGAAAVDPELPFGARRCGRRRGAKRHGL